MQNLAPEWEGQIPDWRRPHHCAASLHGAAGATVKRPPHFNQKQPPWLQADALPITPDIERRRATPGYIQEANYMNVTVISLVSAEVFSRVRPFGFKSPVQNAYLAVFGLRYWVRQED